MAGTSTSRLNEEHRRWVLYASAGEGDGAFANAVARAGRQWKPVAVHSCRVDETIRAVEPEAVVVSTKRSGDERLLRRTVALHGRSRLVIDDRHLNVLTHLLSAAR